MTTSATLDLCEVRFAPPAEDGTVEGFAVRFNVVDTYKTTFDRRAFELDGKPIPLLWSHKRDEVVGSIRKISAENEGLKFVGKLNLDIQRAREVRSMLVNDDINGLSIGFQRITDERRAGSIHITKAALREVSFVAFPSVPGSVVTGIRTIHPETGRDSAAAFLEACRKAARAFS